MEVEEGVQMGIGEDTVSEVGDEHSSNSGDSDVNDIDFYDIDYVQDNNDIAFEKSVDQIMEWIV